MRRGLARLLAVGLLLAAGPAAGQPALKLPPPDLTGLLPLAALPLDKPPVLMPRVAAPVPQALPDLPPPRPATDVASRPVAPMPPPRALACNPVGTLFGVASELLECGRARYQRGELEAARTALLSAAQGGSDLAVQREARYWLAETLVRLGRPTEADPLFALVARDDPRGDLGMFSTHMLGWLALEANQPARALTYFEALLKGRMPVVLIPYARHGRAIALYGLKRYAEARDEWMALLAGNPPPPRPLAVEATFWLGDTLGRLGDYKGAVARLSSFTAGGSPLFMENGWLSLGWWSRAAGQPQEAVKAYRALLASPSPSPAIARWARAGLVLALLDQDDYAAAREEARRLEASDKASPLVLPTLLSLRKWTADKGKTEEARALDTDLLERTLEPTTRAWVLLLSADLARQSGNSGEARDRLELVRASAAPTVVKQQADLRMAQLDFDGREYAPALAAAQRLLGQPLDDDVRAAALLLAAESAYWARDYTQAATLYARFLSDFSSRPEAPSVGLALGWAEFRRGRLDAARERWTAFATESPSDPRAAEALLLAAELAARAGDPAQARSLFDRVARQYPNTDQADVAALNRAILALNAGRPTEALAELGRLGVRASAAPHLSRARTARGLALLASNRPAPAETELRAALGQGDDAIGHLGLGVIAFGRNQMGPAEQEFTAARDSGAGAVAAAGEYGIAAVAFNQGKLGDFKKIAEGLLTGPVDPSTPRVLYGMDVVAVEEKRWPDARSYAMRLADQFPRHEVTPLAVAAVGAGAGAAKEWPLARDMYQILATRYPSTAARQSGRLVFGEALLRTGSAADARRELDAVVASAPAGDPARVKALQLLGEAQEATGDRAAAAQSYARFATENPAGQGATTAVLAGGRLLQADGKWAEARPLLERAVKEGDVETTVEAAYHMGEGLRAAGQNDEAVDAYLTAAYLAPDSVWGRRALLGAGRAFAAAKQNDAATVVYKKLLASSSVEPDLAEAARSGLKALGVN